MPSKNLAAWALAGAAAAVLVHRRRRRRRMAKQEEQADEEEGDPLGFLKIPSLSQIFRSPTLRKAVAMIAAYVLLRRVASPSLQRARRGAEYLVARAAGAYAMFLFASTLWSRFQRARRRRVMEHRRRASLVAMTGSSGDGSVTVRPPCGPVVGALGVHVPTREESSGEGGDGTPIAVACFKGIPYAEPPVGDLRFAEPRPLPPWSEAIVCKDFGEQGWYFLSSSRLPRSTQRLNYQHHHQLSHPGEHRGAQVSLCRHRRDRAGRPL